MSNTKQHLELIWQAIHLIATTVLAMSGVPTAARDRWADIATAKVRLRGPGEKNALDQVSAAKKKLLEMRYYFENVSQSSEQGSREDTLAYRAYMDATAVFGMLCDPSEVDWEVIDREWHARGAEQAKPTTVGLEA